MPWLPCAVQLVAPQISWPAGTAGPAGMETRKRGMLNNSVCSMRQRTCASLAGSRAMHFVGPARPFAGPMLPHASHVVARPVQQVYAWLGGGRAAFWDEVVHVHVHLGARRRGGWVGLPPDGGESDEFGW